jgi:hypothetical protein
VAAQRRELTELLRRDLVARARQVDRNDFLHLGRGVREDDDAVGEVDRLVDVVRDEEDRDSVLVAHLQHQVLQVASGLRVHRCERLVHEQDLRLVGERAGDRDPLLHAARQLPRVAVEEARQADRRDRLHHEPVAVGARHLLVPQRQQHVVPDRGPRHQRAAVLLEDERQLLGRRRNAPAAQQHLAAGRAQQARDALQERRLAAARRADDADELALAHVERDLPDRVRRLRPDAVRLAEPLDAQQFVHCGVAARHPRCHASTRRSARRKRTFRR